VPGNGLGNGTLTPAPCRMDEKNRVFREKVYRVRGLLGKSTRGINSRDQVKETWWEAFRSGGRLKKGDQERERVESSGGRNVL